MNPALAAGAALGAAICFGIAAAGQHRVAAEVPTRTALDPRLLTSLLHKSAWWLTIGLESLAVLLQYLALREGSVALVQSLLVLGLAVAVVLTRKGRLAPRALWGLALTSVGVAALGILVRPDASTTPARLALLPLGIAVVAAGLARRATGPLLGLLAGIVTGCGAVLLAESAQLPLSRLLLHATPYAAVVAGLLAIQLGQSTMASARPAAPLAALTLAEPVTALLLAAVTLHQQLPTGVAVVLAALAAGVGVVLLHVGAPVGAPAEPTRPA